MEGHVGAVLRSKVLPGLHPSPSCPRAAGLLLQPPSPTLVAAPLFSPHCFLVLRKVPAAPEAAVGPATRPQAPEPLANGTPVTDPGSREAGEQGKWTKAVSSVNSPSWRALMWERQNTPSVLRLGSRFVYTFRYKVHPHIDTVVNPAFPLNSMCPGHFSCHQPFPGHH